MSEENSPYQKYIDQLHDSAAHGDISGIAEALKVVTDINVGNNRGWTALMFAARNGHATAVQTLIENGCDISVVNSLGQTAKDIAEFWLHDDIVNMFSQSPESNSEVHKTANYFCENPLNRMSNRRSDVTWLTDTAAAETTVYILFAELDVLAQPIKNSVTGSTSGYRVIRFAQKQVESYLEGHKPTVVFLGVDESCIGSRHCAWFAVDASSMSVEDISKLHPEAERVSIHPRMLQMPRTEAAIVGQARSMLAWHDRYKFCATCGGPTQIRDAGYKRVCLKQDCRSNSGVHNTCYPRTDPTVIVAVLSHDKSKLLLGRGRRFPGAMYSCLAGFMEPGETIEEACRREVDEESGIRLGRVEYHSCQPWPMPSSLMIGCIGHAESDVITVDKSELEDARWFTVQDVRLMLTRQHPQSFFCPPPQAIAHQLIRHSLSLMSKL